VTQTSSTQPDANKPGNSTPEHAFTTSQNRHITKYFTTTRRFWHTAIAAEAEYRLNFVTAALSSIMGLLGAVYTLSLLYREPDQTLSGWTWHEALLITAIFTLLDGFQATFLAPNRMQVSELVRSGKLDFVLLKPIDSQFWISTRQISLWGIPRAVLGLGLLVYAGNQMPKPLGLLDYASGIIPMACAMVVLYSLGYLLSTLSIWFIKLYNITIAMQSLLEAGRYPIQAYPAVYRILFTFIIPVAFLTTVPAQSVLGKPGSTPWLLGAVVAASVLLIASRGFWRFALRSYTSASS